MGYRTRLGTPLSIIPTLGRTEGRRKRDRGREERRKTEGRREGHETRRPRCLLRRSGGTKRRRRGPLTSRPKSHRAAAACRARREDAAAVVRRAAGAMAAGESGAEAPQTVLPKALPACVRGAFAFRPTDESTAPRDSEADDDGDDMRLKGGGEPALPHTYTLSLALTHWSVHLPPRSGRNHFGFVVEALLGWLACNASMYYVAEKLEREGNITSSLNWIRCCRVCDWSQR